MSVVGVEVVPRQPAETTATTRNIQNHRISMTLRCPRSLTSPADGHPERASVVVGNPPVAPFRGAFPWRNVSSGGAPVGRRP